MVDGVVTYFLATQVKGKHEVVQLVLSVPWIQSAYFEIVEVMWTGREREWA
jgi:hypothetical protein